MDPFEPPGDPGDPGHPGDRENKPQIHKEHYVDTEAHREKEIRPEMVENKRSAKCNNNLYQKGIFSNNNTDKEANEAKSDADLAKRNRNNISIIERTNAATADRQKHRQQRYE